MTREPSPAPGWEELPQPRHLADRVIDTVRRRRRAVAIGAGALLVPVAVFVVVAGGTGSRPAGSLADRHAPRPATSQPTLSDRVAIYLAGVQDAAVAGEVFIDDPALPAADRQALTRTLGSRVHFGAPGRAVPPAGTSGRRGLLFGAPRLTGGRATLPRTVLCGPMCLEGKTLVLAHHGRAWQVVGTTGPEWMS